MTQSQRQWRVVSRAVISLLGLALLAGGGCKDRADSTAVKQANQSVAEAGRLLRAADQPAPLTDDELIKATELQDPYRPGQPSAAATRLADRAITRLENQPTGEQYQALLDQLDQLNEQLAQAQAEPEAVTGLAGKIANVAQKLIVVQEQLQAPSVELNQQRMDQARKSLKAAIAAASTGNLRSAQVGPLVMLGTLEMSVAGNRRAGLSDLAAQIRSQQAQFGRLLGAYARESIVGGRLAGYNPQETAALLADQLEGNQDSLRNQLAQAKEQVASLTETIAQTQQRYDDNLTQAQQLHRQYLEVLEQADQARGDDRYELRQQAYVLKVGAKEAGQSDRGVLYYDGQVERTRNELDVLQSQLGYQELRRDRLSQAIEHLQAELAQLNDEHMLNQLQANRQASEQYRQNLAEQISGQLEQMVQKHETYVASYQGTVEAYEQAGQAFNKAGQAAPTRDKATRDYARKMGDWVALKVADLGQAVIEHCNSSAAVVRLAADVGPVASTVEQLCRQYTETAQEAVESSAGTPEPDDGFGAGPGTR